MRVRNKAIYWDGRNDLGENVASGVYFYHLMAGGVLGNSADGYSKVELPLFVWFSLYHGM